VAENCIGCVFLLFAQVNWKLFLKNHIFWNEQLFREKRYTPDFLNPLRLSVIQLHFNQYLGSVTEQNDPASNDSWLGADWKLQCFVYCGVPGIRETNRSPNRTTIPSTTCCTIFNSLPKVSWHICCTRQPQTYGRFSLEGRQLYVITAVWEP